MIRNDAQLEFENGNLVKVDGKRYNYMGGDDLISLVRVLGQRLHVAREKLGSEDIDGKPVPGPCGYSEPESTYRDPETGAHRTAKCEGGRLVVRGNYIDSCTDGNHFISLRPCPKCET